MSKARAEIDRQYFVGEALMRAGEALFMFLLSLLGLTGLRLEYISHGARLPIAMIFAFTAIAAVGLALYGRRMRRSATALDRKG
jgi:FtsH-binding integral membrane protein